MTECSNGRAFGRLTEKQRRFVEAYMGQAKGNATEAARLGLRLRVIEVRPE